jgi:hypothetical protein
MTWFLLVVGWQGFTVVTLMVRFWVDFIALFLIFVVDAFGGVGYC